MIVRMASFVADLRYCLRVLSRSPGFALMVVLTLGICIGANTAFFSAVNAILIQPLPAPHSERLVRLYQTNLQSSNRGPTSIANLLDWQHENEAFSGLAGYAFKGLALQDRTGAEGILSAAVSTNYFAVLGLTARFGRTFNLEEDQSGHDHVVILSDRLCRRLYGDETDVMGKSLRLNGESYVVVGVMPDTVTFPNERVEAWVPLSFSQDQLQSRGNNWVSVVGRLKDGVSFAQAQQAMSTLAHRLASLYPDSLTDHGIELKSLHQDTVGDTGPTLLLLQATVACTLLIAALNVANLSLTRAVGRQTEIATRSALGASRGRLIRELLTESTLLGLGSRCLDVLVAQLCVELLAWVGRSGLHRLP